MRKLTLNRRKSFVGCAVKLKVYIEDATDNDILIDGVPCRKLGEIKNNEEAVFEIGEQEARVFVIADRITKNYCNDFYRVPAGQEDVALSGKNRFNPFAGNPFWFDNNITEETLRHRTKTNRKGWVVFVAALLIGFAVGFLSNSHLFFGSDPQPKTFSDSGMSIVLTTEFKEAEIENFTVCYDSRDIGILCLKEEFTLFEGLEEYSLEEYGLLALEYNEKDSLSLNTNDGLMWFEYDFTNPDTNETYRYYSYLYKGKDAFWIIQFAAETEIAEKNKERIIEWAKSVSFV